MKKLALPLLILFVLISAPCLAGQKSPATKGSHIVVDQLGYLPGMAKVAVIRSPVSGQDKNHAFLPGDLYELVNVDSREVVYSAEPIPWNGGKPDRSAGDKAWRFDFSTVVTEGQYYVRDRKRGARSFNFTIAADVYRDTLREAFRTFFYQRAGFAKQEPWAEAAWADGASHLGPGQDSEARRFDARGDASTARDLSGGWYDAGDYNKYTNWTADYVLGLLHSWLENPAAWGDDFNIPESGNAVPDILDEVAWGVAWLQRMQQEDGSCLSIVGLDHASPPSAADGPSYYGPSSTSATLSCAGAFAFASKVFSSQPQLQQLATELATAARSAWSWAVANPAVVFRNNDPAYGSQGLGAGQQEISAQERLYLKIRTSVYLLDTLGDGEWATFVSDNYRQLELMRTGWLSPWRSSETRTMLYYTGLAGADQQAAAAIRQQFADSMKADHTGKAFENDRDPYLAYLDHYTWGSSGVKAGLGMYYLELVNNGLAEGDEQLQNDRAAHYLHYLHGVNPLSKVYLSNMGRFAAENSVTSFYHSWFQDGSPLWDDTRTSQFGPAPGFVVGGANSSYSWDGCCPSNCGAPANNARCGKFPPSPPAGQPPQKSYTDFNTSWPLNSWSVTENSGGYQVNYLRLLSKFVQSQ